MAPDPYSRRMSSPQRKYWMAARTTGRLAPAETKPCTHRNYRAQRPWALGSHNLLSICAEPEPAHCSTAGQPRWMEPGTITAHFQPIYRVRGDVMPPVAVESLARGTRSGAFGSPAVMFAAAREKGLVETLDCRCIRAAFEAAQSLSPDLDLFLNVHPRTLCLCSDFPAFLADEAARSGIALTRITLEVLEHARVADRQCCQLHASLEVLRDLGVRVAVDDVGAEPEEARRLLLFRPHYLKLDAGLV